MLDDFTGGRKSGFPMQTENDTTLSPENFFVGGFESALEKVGRTGVGCRRLPKAILQKIRKAALRLLWFNYADGLPKCA